MSRIRSFRDGDEPAMADICLKTADAGADATGLLIDDALWAEVFVLPYAARHPEFAFVVETDDARVAGYAVATPGTDAFEAWFRDHWWPARAERYALSGLERTPVSELERTRQDATVRYANGRRPGAEPLAELYPAHLHVDLLPELQGRGWGRRLVETLVDALRDAGVPGLHLVASAGNTGAIAFYPRLGFAPLPAAEGARAFGMRL